MIFIKQADGSEFKIFKQIVCKVVFGHKFELDPGGRFLSDTKCIRCGKLSRFWDTPKVKKVKKV